MIKVTVLKDGQAISREGYFREELPGKTIRIVCPPLGYGATNSASFLVAQLMDFRPVLGDWLLGQAALEFDAILVGRWHPVLLYAGKTDQPIGLVQFAHQVDELGWTAEHGYTEPQPGDMHVYGLLFEAAR